MTKKNHPNEMKIYTIIDLVDLVLEFVWHVPNRKEWNFKRLKRDRLFDGELEEVYLLQKIVALANAFFPDEMNYNLFGKNYKSLPLSLQYYEWWIVMRISDAGFLDDRTLYYYQNSAIVQDLLVAAQQEMNKKSEPWQRELSVEQDIYEWYHDLLLFKTDIHKVLREQCSFLPAEKACVFSSRYKKLF